MDERPDLDLRSAVVVPARPGPLVELADLERAPDDIDVVLDDVFGAPDDRGPGVLDGVLVVGGLGAVVVGQAASLAGIVTVCGAAAIALGAVLPLRSLWRRAGAARRAHRLEALLGDGVLLRTDHPALEQLLAADRRVRGAAEALAPTPRARVEAVAHGALLEVATLLGGRRPSSPEELDYLAARTRALADLAATIADPRVGDGEPDRRRALVEARREIEQLTGASSLTDATQLSRDLLSTDDP